MFSIIVKQKPFTKHHDCQQVRIDSSFESKSMLQCSAYLRSQLRQAAQGMNWRLFSEFSDAPIAVAALAAISATKMSVRFTERCHALGRSSKFREMMGQGSLDLANEKAGTYAEDGNMSRPRCLTLSERR
jgi:hypothetical protein